MANQYRSVLAGASGGGDALPAEVLSGKTFTNDNGPQTGAMTNNGAVSQTLAAGASYTIPEGYHNGSGTVTAINNITDIQLIGTDAATVTGSCSVDDLLLAVNIGTLGSVSGVTLVDSVTSTGISVHLFKATGTSFSIASSGTPSFSVYKLA